MRRGKNTEKVATIFAFETAKTAIPAKEATPTSKPKAQPGTMP